ncbi:1-phosphatidylinositol-4-phosphate 5-kinase [Kwoniella heveanensis CBS 569]|nr:1-phosphatidylinositol-4-phosphate 5-kinase [Kwoniella heveanensis CBS 569]
MSLSGCALSHLTRSEQHASPRINPFHLLSHPDSTSPLPPLPPHLQALASDTGDPSHNQENGGFLPSDPLSPPVHITKVTPTTVEITSETPDGTHRRLIKKVSNVFRKNPIITDHPLVVPPLPASGGTAGLAGAGRSPIMQGPPPSPPLSEAGDTTTGSVIVSETTEEPALILSPVEEVSSPITLTPHNVPYESPSIAQNFTTEPEPGDLGGSPISLAPPIPNPRRVSSSSATSSRAGSLSIVRSGRLAPQRDQDGVGLGLGKGKDLPDLPFVEQERRGSAGSLLPPGSASGSNSGQPRMTRRSTNPSPNPQPAPRSPLIHSQSNFSSPTQQTFVSIPGLEGAKLASDILAQTELLRQQKLERKQKKASAASVPSPATAEAEPRAEEKPKEKQPEETKVLVGNLIGEDHVNYVLMYNMLTGIRIGVSRCQAKIKRPLTEEDYIARHKFSFDIVGNELTPSARYDFKFKDYAPWVFRDLRDEHFHLDPADYLLSLTAKYILSELGSPGKSGSFFYFSRDYRFIIKTISHAEHKFLRSILKDYHEHVKSNPHTLLSRFYGLHRVKLPRGRKIHFVIMNNLFPPHRDIHETYDLKGSAFGREYPEEKAAKNPRAVLKDKNWVNRGRTLELGPEKRALLTEQLRRDMEFLKRVKVMDYSLLVGIHNMERGNRDNLRENQLTMFHPEVPPVRRKPSAAKGPSEASNVRKAVRRSDPKMLDVTSQLPNSDSADRRHFLFYQDEGGLRATDEANMNMDVIYYLGVIDICTPYNTLKKIEHFWKSMTEDRHTISCIDPVTYGQRFLNFLTSVMRGGDKSLRPLGLEEPTSAVEEKPVGGDQDQRREVGEEVVENGNEDGNEDRNMVDGGHHQMSSPITDEKRSNQDQPPVRLDAGKGRWENHNHYSQPVNVNAANGGAMSEK